MTLMKGNSHSIPACVIFSYYEDNPKHWDSIE